MMNDVRQINVKNEVMSRAFCAVLLLALVLSSAVSTGAEYIVENYAIAQALTDQAGDPERGKAVMIDRELGNCLSCHEVPIDAEFFGTTGPTLAGVGHRLTPAQLRLRLVNSKAISHMSMMPSYYKSEGLYRVLDEFEGKSILTAQQIEDVIAYLATLKR